jgi:hypothetical protein
MNEETWLACTEPRPMIDLLLGRASDRKLRLFAVACCRRVGHLLTDHRSRGAVELAERVADGGIPAEQLGAVWQAAARAAGRVRTARGGPRVRWAAAYAAWQALAGPVGYVAREASLWAAAAAAVTAAGGRDPFDWHAPQAVAARRPEYAAQAALLREITGNPFRPSAALNPAWLTPAVLSIARAAYEERQLPAGTLDPARLAVLADALEQSGCQDEAVLGHLRGPGPHVRGCFVVDALLGKG